MYHSRPCNMQTNCAVAKQTDPGSPKRQSIFSPQSCLNIICITEVTHLVSGKKKKKGEKKEAMLI